MFASVLMVTVLTALLPIYLVPIGELVWKPFALFVGAIQAFIFALLTIIYLSIGMSTEHSDAGHEASAKHGQTHEGRLGTGTARTHQEEQMAADAGLDRAIRIAGALIGGGLALAGGAAGAAIGDGLVGSSTTSAIGTAAGD